MNFVTQLEDYLRDLGAEARKKHPGVKEASERAILKLRTLQTQYVTAVRKASSSTSGEKHPDTTLFRSSDLLHPFLLAANYPNASPKLLDTSFKAMKLLMEADAICSGDGMNMVRVWMIQAQVVVSYSETNNDGNNSMTSGGLGLGGMGGLAISAGGKLSSLSNAVTSASNALAGATGTKTVTTASMSNTTATAATPGSQESNPSTSTTTTTSTDSKDTTTASNSATTTTTTTTTTSSSSSSSWFGGYFYSSSPATSSTTNNATNVAASESSSKPPEQKLANVVTAKSAVSSSHGQAGSGHLNAKDLEKIALDILSCLLQLLELRDLPVPKEQWIQSVTICCLLYLPLRQNVRQAAHSTLPQVLTLLFKDKDATQLAIKTWEDLLTCALGFTTSSNRRTATGNGASDKRTSLHGAFSGCRLGEKDAAQPPSPSLSLDLMATLLTESPDIFPDVGQKTFGVIVQALQNQSKINSNSSPLEYLRALQFALIVLQTQGTEWPAECRELLGRVIQPIAVATEALRKQADFEDGYIYKIPNKQIPGTSSSFTGNKIETLNGLPPTVLWKAALSMETLKIFVQDKSNKSLWLHPDVVGHVLETTSDFCTIGASCEDHMNLLVRACRVQGESTSLAYSVETLDSMERWKKGKTSNDFYVLGDALWAGLLSLLKVIEQLDEAVLEQAFAPSLSLLQHYLKRFPANGTIVQRSLEGYFSLSKVSLNVPILRGALMASLCKLSLPHWGSNDSSAILRDHNIAALICLLNIVHRYHDKIGSDWSLVVQTLEELSGMAISSPELSDRAYVGALSISAVYTRLAPFSTCLSDESLLHLMKGLKEIVQSGKPSAAIPSPVGGAAIRKAEKVEETREEKASISAKLINIGVRAIPWNNDSDAQPEDVPVTERTKSNYCDDYTVEFGNRLENSRHPIRNQEVSFSVALLADVAMSNGFRRNQCGPVIFDILCSLASESSASRQFLMDIVAMMIMSHVGEEDSIPALFIGPSKILYSDPRQNQYLAVERVTQNDIIAEAVSQSDLMAPICRFIAGAKSAAVAEVGLDALYSILESTGHKMRNETWENVIEAIACVPTSEHSFPDWTNSCQVGFRCLKLIVDDFLEDAATAARTALLDCCSTFGSSRQDVNTSLTAIGLLWTIADQDSGTESVERALSKLVLLSADNRPEVRNCAVNTLFSCIVGRGQTFTGKQWESCVCTTIFGVYDAVTIDNQDDGAAEEVASKKKSRYQVSVHHSRDSTDKQWLATQALVLRGLCRVLRNFFGPLLNTTDDGSGSVREDHTPWFDKAWTKILGFAYEASTQVGGRDTLELRNSGVELLVLCNQLACTAGMQAAITPARVGTNMEVVNGALRSVRTPEKTETPSNLRHSHSAVTEMWRENLFLDAFDVLDSYREHLESDYDNSDSTHVQVLTKLASELSKLYVCCKDHEFAEDVLTLNPSSSVGLVDLAPKAPSEDDTMIRRFVRVVTTVARSSSSGPDSRFLSQAQRQCLEILKTMISNGSPEAWVNLTLMAGSTLFYQGEPDGKPKKGVDVLCYESSSVLVGGISNTATSDESKVIVLYLLLCIYLEEVDVSPKIGKNEIERTYSNLVPIMKEGLTSAKKIDQRSGELLSTSENLLDALWNKVLLSLSRLFGSISSESKLDGIFHAPNLVSLVKAGTDNVPERHISGLCSILTTGASTCLALCQRSDLSLAEKESLLHLLAAFFAGASNNDLAMQQIGKQILGMAAQSLNSSTPSVDFNVQASLKICEALQECNEIENAVIAIFPELSRLVGVEDTAMRRAASVVLTKANISEVLRDAQTRYERAEERSSQAERRVAELENEVELLQKEKEALERQLGLL
ncbi:C-terminal region of mon2 domain containing protein [Nitzschia inconspicua]|uniref:C-terminal region of mon2 domain containing protein n=1 Tax=Nitzschia inconspicua TaxID=303405 RepID=A0A9K3L1L3_9STRA|nr:C-terminal region of mon2 domain containing protein [Nitzschia inconspicua]